MPLPGSKSISNRVLLLAALSPGTTTMHDLLDSDDTRVMLDALRDLGCQVAPPKVTRATGADHRHRRCLAQQRARAAVPGQCWHRHAPADGRPGGAGRPVLR